ncbi:MAG: DUF72 domain-containing protein, partial [Actinobacteria bacterium]|nr:DUF72 domain-containing protein [Actinomycetota bacterium]
MIYVGTSGWQYESWNGRFYPRELKKTEWLPFFSERFSTVEVNNSFYRLPSREAFARWRQVSADGFVICVKMSRFVTHIKRLKDPQPSIEMFFERARALGEKLGPVLFQFPPTFARDEDRLSGLLDVLPHDVRFAFEFRHASWESEHVRALLDARGCAVVLADRPGWRVRTTVTGGWSY